MQIHAKQVKDKRKTCGCGSRDYTMQGQGNTHGRRVYIKVEEEHGVDVVLLDLQHGVLK